MSNDAKVIGFIDLSHLNDEVNRRDYDAAEEAQYRWENGGEQDALEAMWDRQEQEDAKKLPYCDCNRCLGFGDVPVSECKRD